jgi:hypothetical protein
VKHLNQKKIDLNGKKNKNVLIVSGMDWTKVTMMNTILSLELQKNIQRRKKKK